MRTPQPPKVRDRRARRILAVISALMMLVASCGGDAEPLDPIEAADRLQELVGEIGWQNSPVTRKANVPPPTLELEDTLPPIDE